MTTTSGRRSGHVVVAPDKFKGSLTAAEVGAAGRGRAARRAARRSTSGSIPVADGGDGTLDAAVGAGFERLPVSVSGPVGRALAAAIAVRDDVAVVELALASGLVLLPVDGLEPLAASSFGTGELILAALDKGCTTVVLGVGGSACTDGGAGLLQALGVRFLDADGVELARGGGALVDLATVDRAGLDSRPGRRRVRRWPATSTTRCSGRAERPRSTARRRAPPRPTSSGWTRALARLAAALDPARRRRRGAGRGRRGRLRRAGGAGRHAAARASM